MPNSDDQGNSDQAAVELRLLKGTDDSLPEDQILRQQIIEAICSTFELYGFSPVETPSLCFFDILASKYAGGDEILKETYRLTDQGGRELGLRYDLTVPFARLVGMYQGARIRLPFKRYEVGKVFRDGPIKKGRLREFIQCDADIVGTANPLAEAELVSLADRAFERLGLKVRCEINNRRLLAGIVEGAGFPPELVGSVVLSVDKLKKIGQEGVEKEIRDKLDPGVPVERGQHLVEIHGAERVAQWRAGMDQSLERLFALLLIEGTRSEQLARLRAELPSPNAQRGLDELERCFAVLDPLGLGTPIEFTPSLARGLEIYTGTVCEFFLRDESVLASSLAAGGRFDRIIGQFLHPDDPAKAEDYPAVGLSFGVAPIQEAVRALRPESASVRTVVQVVVVPLGAEAGAFHWAEQLRSRGVRTDLDLSGRRLRKALEAVNALGVPYVAIIGENEVAGGKATLRDMRSGRQEMVDLDSAVGIIRDNLWSGPAVDSSRDRHAE
jgi:histidyl-tRNA synthetase